MPFPEAWCSQCSFRVRKNVPFDGLRSEQEQVLEAFAPEAQRHEHDRRFIRVSWQSGGGWLRPPLGFVVRQRPPLGFVVR